MTAVKQTLAAFIATYFGKSEKVISEKLSTEEHNNFTADAQKLQDRITSLESDKTTLEGKVTALEGERDTLASDKTTLEGKVTALEGDKTALAGKLTAAETDRDKYKGWFEKQKGVGAQLPDADETSKGGAQMTDYNADALAMFRKHNS
jgi:outer membrane murein-binding lipoprotein Lpp